MERGRVYWITGLSGSGKTTIGTALFYELKRMNKNVVILDGDILKLFMGEKIGYGVEDRLARGKRYSELCKTLADQGLWVIICTVAMFDEIRAWNRKNIKGYIEIFLDVPLDVLRLRDKKGLYSDRDKNYEKVARQFEFPKYPDIVLHNVGELRIWDAVSTIVSIQPKEPDDFDRDRAYWNEYYRCQPDSILRPSNFAVEVAKEMSPGLQLLDLGCGNGRDSLYFLEQGLYVTGVDASDIAVAHLQMSTRENPRALFVCDDFVKCRALYQRQYDYIYSRFTLHAITASQQRELLKNIRDALKPNGKLFIEARSIHDALYGKGKQVEKNAYIYDGHFRRFLDPESLSKELSHLGFSILQVEESQGFSPQGDSDPVLMRIVACF